MPIRLAQTLRPEILAAYHEKPFETPVIGVTGGKGGVGKTTVAVNLACALMNMGYAVALVDADVDAPNAAILLTLALENPEQVSITVPEIVQDRCVSCGACVAACRLNSLFLPRGKTPLLLGACNGCEACLLACGMSAIRRGKKAIGSTYKSKRENLTLYTGELIPTREESALVVDQLRERVFREAKDYDMILVDTSPGVHCNVIKALQGSDCVIAVTEPTPLAAHDLELILRLLDIFELKAAVFLNRADLPSAKEAAQKIARQHDLRIAAELDTDALLVKSYVSGIPVVTMCPEAASTRVFLRLAEALAREYLT